MTAVIQSVPNFSEGRDTTTLEALRTAAVSVPHVTLLDVHADRWHHRSVFTLIGPPAAVVQALFAAAQVALARIDLRRHRGEHPRIGATDVIPLIPLRHCGLDECAALAATLAEMIGVQLGIPAYLYGHAARHPARQTLARLRGRGFESLRERMGSDPLAIPDYGPPRVHPSAGATAVGARSFLVAFNAGLDTVDVSVARAIAADVRTSSGGLPGVQAKGFLVDGSAQVSMNLTDIERTSLAAVLTAVRHGASRRGVHITRTELVGLIPERALRGIESVDLPGLDVLPEKILERRVAAAGY